ncbi:MAG: epoxyqueuosine reductase QueH [Planctomycetota bacterium]
MRQDDDPPPPIASPPGGARRLALHACCAVCAGTVIESLLAAGLEPVVVFANANIDTYEEYRRRLADVERFCAQRSVACVALDHRPAVWAAAVAGLEDEPERGARCGVCFRFRLARAAAWAADNQIGLLATTLGIARMKDLAQVHAAAAAAVADYAGVDFWPHNWRKRGGAQRMYRVAARADLYRQNYCGCWYSRR